MSAMMRGQRVLKKGESEKGGGRGSRELKTENWQSAIGNTNANTQCHPSMPTRLRPHRLGFDSAAALLSCKIS